MKITIKTIVFTLLKILIRLVFIVLLLGSMFYISNAQSVNVYCNDDSCAINAALSSHNLYHEYRDGYAPKTIKVYRIVENDTSLLLMSIGCSQFSIEDKLLTIYIWLGAYTEHDCICIDETELPCRPDSTLCNITIQYQYLNNQPQVSVSNIDYSKYLLAFNVKNHDISYIKSNDYIKLNQFNSIFRKNKYDYSYTYTTDLLKDESALFKEHHLTLYLFGKQDIETFFRLRYNLNAYAEDLKEAYYYKHDASIAKFLCPMQNKQYTGSKIRIFQKNMRKLIKTSYPNVNY